MHRRSTFVVAALVVLLAGALAAAVVTSSGHADAQAAAPANPALQERADHFLAVVNSSYQALRTVSHEAEWAAATDVTPAHDAAAAAAGKALAAFSGDPVVITQAKELLAQAGELDPLTVRQLRRVLLNAAEGPMTNPPLVAARIDAETAQASTLNSFPFELAGRLTDGNRHYVALHMPAE